MLIIQLNLHETDLLFRYLSHHLTWHCPIFLKICTDLQEICSICSQNCFCFDFHISAEQFYDHKKQELGKGINQQAMPCQMMAQVSK